MTHRTTRPAFGSVPDPRRRSIVLAATAAPLLTLLPACGGGDAASSRIRVINASLGYSAVDVYYGDSLLVSSLEAQKTSDWVHIPADQGGSATLEIQRNGVVLVEMDFDPDINTDWSAIYSGDIDGAALHTESEDSDNGADEGECRLRIFNASDEAEIDVYLTPDGTPLSDAAPQFVGAPQGEYTEMVDNVKAGTKQLRITPKGDRSVVKLDTEVTLESEGIATLVVLPARSGVLVSAVFLPAEADTVELINLDARLRYVNGLEDGSKATPVYDGSALSGALASRVATGYVEVDSGEHNVGVTIGSDSLVVPETLLPTQDHTWAVYGPDDARVSVLLADDTRPSTDDANARVRVVNLLAGGPRVALSFNAGTAEGLAAPGTAGEYQEVVAGTVDIAIGDAGQQIVNAELEEVELAAGGVYTVFAMRDTTGDEPVVKALLRRDL